MWKLDFLIFDCIIGLAEGTVVVMIWSKMIFEDLALDRVL